MRSAPSACVMPASTPGRSGTCTGAAAASLGPGTRARACGAGSDDASPIQRARIARVALRERRLDLLEPATVLGERVADRIRVVEEDVDPDPRVRAGDARHVAQRAAGVSERLVAVDPRRAGLVRDDVREHVRHVAGERDEPVVGARIDRDGRRAELGDEAVDEAVAGRVGRVRSASGTTWRPGTAPRSRARGRASRLPQIGWPPTKRDEPSAARTTDAFVEPTSVTVAASVACEHRRDLSRQLGDRRGDDDELGAVDGLLERSRQPGGRRARPPAASAASSGSQPHDLVAALPRGERHGGAHQPCTDDCDPHLAPMVSDTFEGV